MNRVDVLYTAADTDIVSEFIGALRARGLRVEPASEHPAAECPLVVLITAAMLEADMAAHAVTVSRRYSEILPVSFLPGPSPLFAELSQSIVAQLGVDECVSRINTIVRFGGKAIVGWNALVAQATRWQTEGRRALLAESEIAGALPLLQSGPAKESTSRELVGDYLQASRQSLRRRRRLGMSVISASSVVLTIVLVLAVVQAIGARTSQLRAERAADVATADRLARVASDLIPGDPDLPTVLALRALEAAPTAAAQDAASRVATSTWPHQSHQLDYRPGQITAASNSTRIAVHDIGHGNAVVYDRPGGEVLTEFAFDRTNAGGSGTLRLSPDGRLIAMQPPNSYGVRVLDIDDGTEPSGTEELERGNATLLGWMDNERILIGRGNKVVTTDIVTGTTHTVAEAAPGELIDSASVNSVLDKAVVSTDASVLVVNLATSEVERTISATLNDPVLSNDGQTIAGVDYPQVLTYSLADDSSEQSEPEAFPARQVVPIDGQFTLLASSEGEISVLGAGRIFQTVRAHLSGGVSVTRLNDGRFASVASDGFLRVWSVPPVSTYGVPTSIGFVDESTRMASSIGVHVSPRESARNQIRRVSEDHLAVTSVPGYAHVLSANALTTTDRRFFSGLTTDISLSRNGLWIAAVSQRSSRSFKFMDSELFWDDEGSSKLPGSKIESAIGDGAKGVSAVSDDGATILIADEYVVSRRRSGDNSDVSFDVARRPVSLSPESTGPGTVLTADGYLRHADGSEERLAFPGIGATDAVELAAAEPDGNGGFTMVTVDGRLFSATSENGVRHLGEIGGGNASFALRVSPHTSQLAVIGEQGLVVFDTAAKRTIFREPAHGQAVLTDVAFADDNATLFAVNQIGAVRSIDISGDTSGDARLVNPRELTADESTLFNVQGG